MNRFSRQSAEIAKYSDNNPDSLLNTAPKYAAYTIAALVLAGGVFVFVGALIAAL
jgi:hypothetical protein